jgi:hypothetical protein
MPQDLIEDFEAIRHVRFNRRISRDLTRIACM